MSHLSFLFISALFPLKNATKVRRAYRMSAGPSDTPFQVVIWEWKNDFGTWEPYEPVVVKAIEIRRTNHNSISLTTLFPSVFSSHQIVFDAPT